VVFAWFVFIVCPYLDACAKSAVFGEILEFLFLIGVVVMGNFENHGFGFIFIY
jgi:hypothetical protein